MKVKYFFSGFPALLTFSSCVEKTILVPELQVGDCKVLVEPRGAQTSAPGR